MGKAKLCTESLGLIRDDNLALIYIFADTLLLTEAEARSRSTHLTNTS